MSAFENLEMLNAQIDIWIDEEEYESVYKALPITNDGLKKNVDSCFEHPNCTQDKNTEWDGILHRIRNSPIQYAYHEDLIHGKHRLNKHWARLFYAKLLRARIQDKGTDCYLKRLDEVEAYLESQLPSIIDENTAKLAVLYLLELAAISQSFEIIGFAERAGRVMADHKKMLVEHSEEFIWFYKLFQSYNLGVGYFHKSHYRMAILEFNRIIEQVRKEKTNESPKLEFFNKHYGYLLLYFPAVIYRADVQLRLQLAYHALDTIKRYLEPENELNNYKKVRKELIATEAYQQMGRLTGSWSCLARAYDLLVSLESSNKLQEQVPQDRQYRLGERTSFQFLPFALFSTPRRKIIKGQFLNFYIEDHLEMLWLGKFEQLKDIKNPQILCSKRISSYFGPRYFNLVQFHKGNRTGYFKQLAKFIAWLSKEPTLVNMAKKLYEHRGIQMLESTQDECSLCTSTGVDWKMNPQYFSWFQGYMLQYFENLLLIGESHQKVESGQR
ncbi:hypothetical protein ACFLVA_00460, partial [Chloroflexota bacterium]